MASIAKIHNRGFTLVELIAVLVILGIVAAIGSSFVVATVNSYDKSEKRSKLIARGRVAIEQITRELRQALPYSLRVSASGNCLEYMPIVAGANYRGRVPDAENLAPLSNSISTSPFELGLGSANHAVVGALSAAEVYSTAIPAARVAISALVGSSPYSQITLSASHRFFRQSINSRVFITDDPRRYCLRGTFLEQYSGYGLNTGGMDDTIPSSANTSLLAENVATDSIAFSLSPGSEDRNTAIRIALVFSERGEQVALYQEVLLRNVP